MRLAARVLLTVPYLSGCSLMIADATFGERTPDAGTDGGRTNDDGGGDARMSTDGDVDAGTTGPTAVTLGETVACAVLADRSVACWGENSMGGVGDGTTEDRPLPVRVLGVGGVGHLQDVVAVSAGEATTCAIIEGGTAVCWGKDESGQLGNGGPVGMKGFSAVPVAVRGVGGSGTLDDARDIDVGPEFVCAVRSDETAVCWGSLWLGDGTMGSSSSPVTVSAVGGGDRLRGARDVSLGQAHACALLADGGVVCWGTNEFGQLGDGTTSMQLSPVVVRNETGSGPLTGALSLTASGQNTCVVLEDRTARCWGDNSIGQLGDGSSSPNSPLPTVVRGVGGVGTLGEVASLAAGGTHTCALLSASDLACWGGNRSGQLGIGTDSEREVATPVRGVGGSGRLTGASFLAARSAASCAVAERSLSCWGWNTSFRLGDGLPSREHRSVPGPVPLP